MASLEPTASCLAALTEQYQMVANNLANASTIGFKRSTCAFSQSLETQLSYGAEAGGAVGTIEEIPAIDFSQGILTRTGGALDLALSGEGFFVLETPEGELYTRNGAFRVNPQGQLVDASGRLVAGTGGPIVVPNTVGISQLRVATDGTVSAGGTSIGQLKLANFADSQALMPAGLGCLRPGESAEPVAPDSLSVQQGFQEASNVNVVEELVNLIKVTRLYEANLKLISKQDEGTDSILQVAMA